ncbi:hypothetical protein PUMCH_001770 [Australozyma saopauloensis]|uniref:Mitochondrial import inner membrane translocase subunit TIM54 n=1 Tax=Australozyma saopauloensis TaxID=291208 RepID=A0AAX4H7W1_9ASCO|nr:hypothetical protein PUMCH_001770 [[Candida] saopauloensis]
MTEEQKTPETKPKVEVPKKKSWSNPALRAMGIPKVSLPSRNWMIFWTVLASIGGGIYYDKTQQKKIREKYCKQVEHLAQEVYTADRLPRKLTVFIAPPPNDFLEESLRHFRKYVKPILNSAAIDYEVYTETRQGDIRAQVAEKIRQMRRSLIEDQKLQEQKDGAEAYNRSWTKFANETSSRFTSVFKRKSDEPEELVSRHDLYETKDVLGLYRVLQPQTPKRDNEDDAKLCGGVICIGRGSYKEYINGIHEGLLGPLEKPEPVVEKIAEVAESESETQSAEPMKEPVPEQQDDIQPDTEEDDSKDKQPPVPAPYITDYSQGQLAPELDFSKTILNSKGVPVIFEQPIYVFPVPKISGFMRMPEKIYNYFTARNLAENVSSKVMVVVDGKSRDFEYKDKFLAGEEELDWPKGWVEKGKKKNSEWVQDLEVDERVTNRLRVFEK